MGPVYPTFDREGRFALAATRPYVRSRDLCGTHGEFKLTGTAFSTAPYGFIVAKGSGLAQPLLAAVKQPMANGQYKKILTKWGVQQGAIPKAVLNGATS